MYPRRRLTPVPASEAAEIERLEKEEEMVEASETDRSRSGHAPRASEGAMLGDGDTDRSDGELGKLDGWRGSAMLKKCSRLPFWYS